MTYCIQGNSGQFELVVGLEVHAQVKSKAKLFSGAPTEYGAEPNTQVSFIDAGMPGMLPVINEVAIEQAVRTGLALNAKINLTSIFDRKNYFYPDLPCGYQISQYLDPIVGEGTVEIDLKDGSSRNIGIERLHLEMDAGKSIHDLRPNVTHVDLNRSGIALMEIVSKPDMRSPEEAGAYLRKLRTILRYVGSCDGNMEQGSMRCDVNVSVRRPGEKYGTRCEIKNVNSVRFVMRAIEYESKRQVDIIEEGNSVDQETRLFDSSKGETRTMRSKEEAHDYRYFPDPDLLPLKIEQDWVNEIKNSLPELPDVLKKRFIKQYSLTPYDAEVLVSEQSSAMFFETVAHGRDGKLAANWVTGEFFGALNKANLNIVNSPITAHQLGGLIDRVSDGTLSVRLAKEVFEFMFLSGSDADVVIEEKGLKQVTDVDEIHTIIDKILSSNTEKVEEFRNGKVKLMGWFVGQVMKESQGKANPAAVNKALKEKLT
ncbi:MAG: Asp-tRNA(Asn)/Glu-tRNA(Gln) amidotransferase GatCAB subunit B [Rhodospirillaceae bacterium]|nr:Asp-tRNA(Asn)/Glu-tRNA(Gln) amidotransferase GatCAB subunit B [Rhodospirillaceae bacterium]|tara:strand:+ start:1622 stop:3073 length:1452 start_codon:yes stop_codon:yes gene_type:complete